MMGAQPPAVAIHNDWSHKMTLNAPSFARTLPSALTRRSLGADPGDQLGKRLVDTSDASFGGQSNPGTEAATGSSSRR